MSFKNIDHAQQGMSLLEVLVAVVVFAVGLLAIASLQGSLFQSGNVAKSRSVATDLAEDRVEEVRAFIDKDDFDAIAGSNETVTESGVEFQRDTTVTDYYYAGAGLGLVEGTDPEDGSSDAKLVSVSVAWCDASAGATCNPADASTEPNTVVVEDIISRSSSPVGSARALSQLSAGAPPGIPYKPGNAPEVISIDLGDGNKKESPEPRIETTKQGCRGDNVGECTTDDAVNNLTRFESITFTPVDNDDEAVNVQRQEFTVANCTCELGGTPVNEEDYGYTPYFWNGTDFVGGEKVAKPVGTSVGVSENDPFLEQICSDCCKNHHDVPGQSIMYDHDSDSDTADILSRFDPFRKDGSGNLTQHSHYVPDNQDQLVEVAEGEQYLEACRFVRVDGLLKVANDFRIESLQALPANTCSDFNLGSQGATCDGTMTNESGAWIDQYRAFVTEFASDFVDGVAASGSYPSSTPDIEDSLASAHNLPTSDSTPLAGTAREVVSRAIYVDYMTPDLLNRIACRKGGGTDCDEDLDPSGASVLSIVPFYEVNVQLQANWATDTGELVEVTSEPIDPAGYNRGFVYPVDLLGGETEVFATIEQGNVGLVDTHDVYPGTTIAQDSLLYGGDGDGGGDSDPVLTGSKNIDPELSTGGDKVSHSDVIVEVDRGTGRRSCSSEQGDEFYECVMNDDASGLLVVSGYTKVKRNGDLVSDNMVCLRLNDGSYLNGTVFNDPDDAGWDPGSPEYTVFDFGAIEPPENRTGYDIAIEPENSPDKCVGSTI